ncbi:MAG TPA: (2Fe-2S)-binding protein [Desulfotomaculum sp.]|nr:(2Fe-2S)-binding protein [Desulfotomaculum sp.]
MRITQHPVIEFRRGRKIKFTFDGKEYEGYEGETIAAALHGAGIRVLRESPLLHRPRGLFCAIGNCSSCLMTVNGEPNVRICVEKLRPGMVVESQKGKGVLHAKGS